MSATVPAERKELAEAAYSRWMGEGGASVTIGEHGADQPDGKLDPDAPPIVKGVLDGCDITLHDGAVVIAAITSCTNTSNPSVMIGAGLLAKKAVERGLETKPWVKSSLAPGSRVVTDYLEGSGLQPYLDKLRFNTVGYGCTTCIGNSGPLPDVIAKHDRRALAGDRRGPERQPELRGAGAPAGAGQLPRVADAGRRLRARRPGGHRPHQGARSARARTASRSSSATSGPRRRRSSRP